jgi:hypothetical protein
VRRLNLPRELKSKCRLECLRRHSALNGEVARPVTEISGLVAGKHPHARGFPGCGGAERRQRTGILGNRQGMREWLEEIVDPCSTWSLPVEGMDSVQGGTLKEALPWCVCTRMAACDPSADRGRPDPKASHEPLAPVRQIPQKTCERTGHLSGVASILVFTRPESSPGSTEKASRTFGGLFCVSGHEQRTLSIICFRSLMA